MREAFNTCAGNGRVCKFKVTFLGFVDTQILMALDIVRISQFPF